jgi:hypothetical protein
MAEADTGRLLARPERIGLLRMRNRVGMAPMGTEGSKSNVVPH